MGQVESHGYSLQAVVGLGCANLSSYDLERVTYHP